MKRRLRLFPLGVNTLGILGVFAHLVPEVRPSSRGTEGKEDAIAHREGLDLYLADGASLAIGLRHSNGDVRESGAGSQNSRHQGV